jgi:hypothetical protein
MMALRVELCLCRSLLAVWLWHCLALYNLPGAAINFAEDFGFG